MVEEMIKLRKKLDELGIKWYDYSDPVEIRREYYKYFTAIINNKEIEKISAADYGIDRTEFKYKNKTYSVINGVGTYGGMNLFSLLSIENKGLLELYGSNMKKPEGFLTADDIIARIEKE